MAVKKIGIDLDDCLCQLILPLTKFHNERYGTVFVPDDYFSYAYHQVWGVSQEEAFRRVVGWAREFLHTLELVEGAKEAIDCLSQGNYELHVITARWREFSEVTHQWIAQHFPGIFSGVHFADHYTVNHREKSEICNALGVDVFIDDVLENVAGCVKPGRQVFLFDAPWNRSVLDMPFGMRRVYSWADILVEIDRGDTNV